MHSKLESSGKEALIQAARGLFLERGYAAVSMQQIAEVAGMTKGAPYYHFRNKDELFLHVFLQEVNRLKMGFVHLLNAEGTVEERLRGAMTYVFRTTQADMLTLFADFDRYMGQECMAEKERLLDNRENFNSILVPFFREAARNGHTLRVSPEQASHLFVMLTMGQLHSMRIHQKLDKSASSPEQIASDLVDILLHGI